MRAVAGEVLWYQACGDIDRQLIELLAYAGRIELRFGALVRRLEPAFARMLGDQLHYAAGISNGDRRATPPDPLERPPR